MVQAWVSGTIPNNSVALALTGSLIADPGSFSFDSKENNLTGHQPELTWVLDATAIPVMLRKDQQPRCA